MRSYDKIKHSGVHWIGEIPEHWEVKRLKYVAMVFPSNVDKKSKEDEEEILLCNYMDVYKNDYINSTIEFMNATASDSQIKTFKLNKGDVLATKDSETPDDIAVAAYVEEDFDNVICGYHLTHIKPNSKNLIGLFLFRLLQSKNYCQYFTTLARGVTRYALNTSAFSEMPTIAPPIKEQIAIANYLVTKTTEIDQTIADKEALINLFEEEKKALINEAVTKGLNPKVKFKPSGIDWLGDIPEHWEVKKLKYVSDIVLGKMLTPEDKGNYFLKPYLKAQNIRWLDVDFSDVKEMWFSESELKSYRIKENDILVSEGGEVGRTCIWKNELEECYIQNSVNKVTVKEGESYFHLYQFYMLGSKDIFNSIVNKVSIAHLTKEKLKEIPFSVPPIKEQTAIVQHIETGTANINEKITLIKQEIGLLKEYKQALIFEAVTGKICVL